MQMRFIVVLGLALIAPVVANAQPKPPSVVVTPPQITQGQVNAAENGIQRGGMDVGTATPFEGVPALPGFRLRFGNGDHKLRQLGVLASTGSTANFSLSDQNGDDAFNAAASWITFRGGGRRGQVSAVGGGRFEIPLPDQKPANHRLVLTGFQFRRQDGTDANVRVVGVWLDETRNVARVSLLDDQGADFRDFASRMGAAVLTGSPELGSLVATGASVTELSRRIATAGGRFRGYAVTVQYAFVPARLFDGEDSFTGTGRVPSSGKRVGTKTVLQGFEFFFENSDHHLLDIGVMPPVADRFFRTRGDALPGAVDEVVAYQDNGRDDPIRWSLKVLNLNGSQPSPHAQLSTPFTVKPAVRP